MRSRPHGLVYASLPIVCVWSACTSPSSSAYLTSAPYSARNAWSALSGRCRTKPLMIPSVCLHGAPTARHTSSTRASGTPALNTTT